MIFHTAKRTGFLLVSSYGGVLNIFFSLGLLAGCLSAIDSYICDDLLGNGSHNRIFYDSYQIGNICRKYKITEQLDKKKFSINKTEQYTLLSTSTIGLFGACLGNGWIVPHNTAYFAKARLPFFIVGITSIIMGAYASKYRYEDNAFLITEAKRVKQRLE